MTKRYSGLVAIGAAALLAVAGAAPAAAQETTDIHMVAAAYTKAMQPYFNDLAARFMEENPDINVTVEAVSWDNNALDNKIKTMVAAGEPPDIANLNYFASFAADDLLYTADQIVDQATLDDLIPAFRENSKYEGVEYAVPDLASDRLFFYNKDILEAAGVEAPPATWSELEAAAEKIKAYDPNIIPLALPMGSEEAQAEFLIWAGGNGGTYYDGENWVVNSAENVETLDFLKSLTEKGYTQPNPGSTDRTKHAWQTLFATGTAAMVNGAVFLMNEMENTYKSDVDYGVSPFLANDGKESLTLGVQDYFFGFKKEGNQEAIQKFLSFLFLPDNYAAFLQAAGDFLPATLSAAPLVSANPALAPFIEVLPSAVFYPGDQAEWPAVLGAMQQTIGTAFTGADSQEVLDTINAAGEQ